jgi:hypothetical protein
VTSQAPINFETQKYAEKIEVDEEEPEGSRSKRKAGDEDELTGFDFEHSNFI